MVHSGNVRSVRLDDSSSRVYFDVQPNRLREQQAAEAARLDPESGTYSERMLHHSLIWMFASWQEGVVWGCMHRATPVHGMGLQASMCE